MLTALWIIGLLVGCIGWAFAIFTATYGFSSSFVETAGVAVGMSIPLCLVTGGGGVIAYAATRKRRKALWTWTSLILLAMAALGIGAAQGLRTSGG